MSRVNQNANFEYMYSPSRAKDLFNKHRELKEFTRQNLLRLDMEKKTTLNELDKSKHMMTEKREELLQKRKEVEERLLEKQAAAHYTQMMFGVEFKKNPLYGEPLKKKPGIGKSKLTRAISAAVPMESLRQPSVVEIFTPADRSQSAVGFTSTEPNGSDTPKRQPTFSGIAPDFSSTKYIKMESLSEDTKYKLRNEEFQRNLKRSQQKLRRNLCNFYSEIDDFKIECRQAEMGKVKNTKAVKTPKEDEVTVSTTGIKKFKISFPRVMTTSYPPVPQVVVQPPPEDNPFPASSKMSQPSLESFHTPWPPSQTKKFFRPRTGYNTNIGSSIPEILKIDEHLNRSASHLSTKGREMEKVKLLYLDSHGLLKIEEPKAETTSSKSMMMHIGLFDIDTQPLHNAFDDFLASGQNVSEMHKMVSLTVKLKHQARKARDRSFIPFISVRKFAKKWRQEAHGRSRDSFPTDKSGTNVAAEDSVEALQSSSVPQ